MLTCLEPTFVYVTCIATTPAKLWEALTTSEYTEKYFFGTSIIGLAGRLRGYLFSEWEGLDYGKIVKCEPFQELSFTWTYVGDGVEGKLPSRVTFQLKPMNATVKLHLDMKISSLVI